MSRTIARYGWVPDLPDQRDFHLEVTRARPLPPHIDLRPEMPAVYDQEKLGSCTANAIAAAYEYESLREGGKAWTPSRLFIYYNERQMEGTVDYDAGAMIRDGVRSVAKLGVVPETEWPYVISQFKQQPSETLYTEALSRHIAVYRRANPIHVRWAIAHRYPVIFGFTVYESFESQEVANTGVMNLPGDGESVLGGHAVLAVGYDDESQRLIVRNSWGSDWGDGGYFTMPYAYILNGSLASDFWTIRKISIAASR